MTDDVESSFRSGLTSFGKWSRAGVDAGLQAAAYIVYNAVKEGLAGGYTSGAFVTGESQRHVTISDIVDSEGSGRLIRVGTDLRYNLFWEIGHHNIFSRRFERVEVWRPAFMETKEQQREAFQRAYQKTVNRALDMKIISKL